MPTTASDFYADLHSARGQYIVKNFDEQLAQRRQDAELFKAEGARGGRVIGHTKSGKPIYEASHSIYTRRGIKPGRYSIEEHHDAARLHGEARQRSVAAARAVAERHSRETGEPAGPGLIDTMAGERKYEYLSHIQAGSQSGWAQTQHQRHIERLLNTSEVKKSEHHGEGSRGGHIIGHTKSGKPVYAASHASYHHLQNEPGYHKEPHDVTVRDTYKVMHAYPGFTAQDHTDAAEAHEDINHHTAASAHFSAAAHVYHAGKGNEHKEADWNDNFGATGNGYDGPKRVNDALGRTYNDHGIPDYDHPKYAGVSTFKRSGVTSDDVPHRSSNGRAVQEKFKNFKAVDHEMAAKAHVREAKKKLDNGAYHLAENPGSEFGHRALHESRHHAAIAQAHNDVAEFLRRKPKKGGGG